jgi:hypothetical protein
VSSSGVGHPTKIAYCASLVGNAKMMRRSRWWSSSASPGTPLQYEKYQIVRVGAAS